MPVLTYSLGPRGPAIPMTLSVGQWLKKALEKAQREIPKPVEVQALIDTGASCSFIDAKIVQRLGLIANGEESALCALAEGPKRLLQYDVAMHVAAPPEKGRPQVPRLHPLSHATRVLALENLSDQGFEAILGCDILGECLFALNGRTKQITFAF